MAKPSWVTLSKSSGTGGGSVQVTASQNTGSSQRSGILTIKTASGLTKSVQVEQGGTNIPSNLAHITLTCTDRDKGVYDVLIEFQSAIGTSKEEDVDVTIQIEDNSSLSHSKTFNCSWDEYYFPFTWTINFTEQFGISRIVNVSFNPKNDGNNAYYFWDDEQDITN